MAAGAAISTAPKDQVFKAREGMTLRIPLDPESVFNGAYAIDSAGYAEIPVLGRLMVAGKRRDEVEAFLQEKLASYLRDTHVQAEPAIRLTLLGHFAQPGQFYVNPDASVWDAIRFGGGVAGERTMKKAEIIRGESVLGISFWDIYSRGLTLHAAGIRSGDIFMVPVPRENTGFWYWFRESLGVTAQIAGIAGSALTVYITYMLLEDRRDNNTTPTEVPVVP
jgi:protein involved in polysaccharide export with SLBB domain